MGVLGNRHDEKLNANLKLAIFIGMLPKEFQDMIWQKSCTTTKLQYEAARDYVVSVVSQRIQVTRPTPMDVGSLDNADVCWPCQAAR